MAMKIEYGNYVVGLNEFDKRPVIIAIDKIVAVEQDNLEARFHTSDGNSYTLEGEPLDFINAMDRFFEQMAKAQAHQQASNIAIPGMTISRGN
jgi:hypothetical protein